MSSLAEEAGDLFHIMEELLVTKRAFDYVEWKNFSKFLKDILCYLTASMLSFWIYKCIFKKIFLWTSSISLPFEELENIAHSTISDRNFSWE